MPYKWLVYYTLLYFLDLYILNIKHEELRKCRSVKQEIFQLMEDEDRWKYYKFRTNNGTVSSECKGRQVFLV